MENWQEDHLGVVISTSSKEDIFASILKIAQTQFGFEFCAYGHRFPLPISRPKYSFISNYPTFWIARYEEQKYFGLDPSVKMGIRTTNMFVWSPQLFSKSPLFWDDAKSAGLQHGWAQSSRGPSGGSGMLTVARSAEPITTSELTGNGASLGWLAQAAHTGLGSHFPNNPVSEPPQELTEREQEVLRWTADGKTSSEIGCILNIAERTVNFHVQNIFCKLGVCSKVSAAVQAVMLGLI